MFDPVGAECKACPTGYSVRPDGLECEATRSATSGMPIAVQLFSTTGTTPYRSTLNCAASNLAVSWDGTTCTTCDTTVVASNAYSGTAIAFAGAASATAVNGECTCAANQIVVEFDMMGKRLLDANNVPTKNCMACTTPHPTIKGRCFECPWTTTTVAATPTIAKMTAGASYANNLCTCATHGSNNCLSGQLSTAYSGAVATALSVTLSSSSYQISYTDLGASSSSVTATSAYLTSNLTAMAGDCYYYANRTACDSLTNMCVLTMYDMTSTACSMYSALVTLRKANVYHSTMSPSVGWSETMPWLFYDTTNDYLTRTDFASTASFKAPSDTASIANLVFVLSITTLSGQWLGFREVGSWLQLCGGREDDIEEWTRIGTNYYNDCTMSLADVLTAARVFGTSADQAKETLFYDLYVQDLAGSAATASTWPEDLYPVPIKVTNIAVNSNAASTDDLYVRRFFMLDETAGVQTWGSTAVGITYAATLEFSITLQSEDVTKMYAPVLTVTYAQRVPSYAYTTEESISFRTTYSDAGITFWSTWEDLMISIMVIFGVHWMTRVVRTSRRRQVRDQDTMALVSGICTAAGHVSAGFVVVLLMAGGYWFIFFKCQEDPYTMIPVDSDTNVKLFKELLVVAVSLASVSMAHTLYWQCNYDVFFLDWEKPRTTTTAGGKNTSTPVSAWRQFFIANEWNKIQSKRLTSRPLTLLFMILFLEGLNYKGLAVIEPTLNTDEYLYYQVQSVMLRYALGAGLMILIAIGQMVYKIVFYHNYVQSPMQQFIDILATSNVSIVILDDECSGYYIHGRSQMAFADTSMAELCHQFRKEEEMQVGARGLVPAATTEKLAENQCFEMFITKELRMAYESKLLSRIKESVAASIVGGGMFTRAMSRMNSNSWGNNNNNVNGYGGGYGNAGYGNAVGGGMVNRPSAIASDATIAAAEEISDIFKQLINFTEANAGSFVLERPFMDKFTDMPPESVSMMQGASPIFYHDFKMAFTRVLFYGIEWQLLIFDVLVFTAIDMEVTSFAIAAFCTWVVGMGVDVIRSTWGEINISRKSLIDQRFLI